MLDRLARGQCVVLDGGLSSELSRRGYRPMGPLLDAAAAREAPEILAAVHRAYIDAGADVISAFTERTTVRALSRGGLGMRSAALTHRAVDIAQEQAQKAGRPVAVAGVLGPLETAPRTPSPRTLADEHAEQASRLAAAGCQLVLIDAMPTLAETLAATAAARSVVATVWATLALSDRAHLLDGTPLEQAAPLVASVGAQVLLLESASTSNLGIAAKNLAELALGLPLGFRAAAQTDSADSAERAATEIVLGLHRSVRVLGGSRAAGVDLVRALSTRVRARAAA